MRHTASIVLLLRCLSAVLIAGLLTAGFVSATPKSPDDLDIVTVSTRPDTVSGGDVLACINVPPGVGGAARTQKLPEVVGYCRLSHFS
jgi:hypothetical protein